METDNLFGRMQELSGVSGTRKKNENEEDSLNYFVYELLSEAELEGKARKIPSGYEGIISFIIYNQDIEQGDFNKQEILESFKFEKHLYHNYIVSNVDLDYLARGEDIKIKGMKIVEEKDFIVLKLRYVSKYGEGEELILS